MGKVVISAGVGALTGGISGLKAIGTTAKVYKAIAASATVGMGEIVQQGYENGTKKPVDAKKLAIELVVDKIPIPKIKSAKLDSSIKVAEKVAKSASRETAKKVAKQEVNKLKNQKAANNVVNEVISSTVKQAVKEPIKNRTN